jgi:hypothetical protein
LFIAARTAVACSAALPRTAINETKTLFSPSSRVVGSMVPTRISLIQATAIEGLFAGGALRYAVIAVAVVPQYVYPAHLFGEVTLPVL